MDKFKKQLSEAKTVHELNDKYSEIADRKDHNDMPNNWQNDLSDYADDLEYKLKEKESSKEDLYDKYENLKELDELTRKYDFQTYSYNNAKDAIITQQNKGKTKEEITGLIDNALKYYKEKFAKEIKTESQLAEKFKNGVNKDNIFDVNERIEVLKKIEKQYVYKDEELQKEVDSAKKELSELEAYKAENENNIVKKTLEGDLPSKLPKAKETLSTNYLGDIDVKPIELKIKKQDPKEALLNNAGDSSGLRPILNGVYYDAERQAMVATDTHQLVVIPSKIEGKSKVLGKDGKEIEGRFPNYMGVVPSYGNQVAEIKDIQSVLNQLNGVQRANRFLGYGSQINAKIEGKYFDAEKLKTALQTLAETGTTNIGVEFYGEDDKKAVIFRDLNNIDKFALVMPASGKTDSYSRNDRNKDVNFKTIDLSNSHKNNIKQLKSELANYKQANNKSEKPKSDKQIKQEKAEAIKEAVNTEIENFKTMYPESQSDNKYTASDILGMKIDRSWWNKNGSKITRLQNRIQGINDRIDAKYMNEGQNQAVTDYQQKVASESDKTQSKKDTQKLNEDFEARQKELEKYIPASELADAKTENKINSIMDKLTNVGAINKKDAEFLNENSFIPQGFKYGKSGLVKIKKAIKYIIKL